MRFWGGSSALWGLQGSKGQRSVAPVGMEVEISTLDVKSWWRCKRSAALISGKGDTRRFKSEGLNMEAKHVYISPLSAIMCYFVFVDPIKSCNCCFKLDYWSNKQLLMKSQQCVSGAASELKWLSTVSPNCLFLQGACLHLTATDQIWLTKING